MFISNTEKYQIQVTIKSLQTTISDLSRENENMKQAIIDLEWKILAMRKPIGRPRKIVDTRSPEAPWGLKKDGTPKKRPGRSVQTKPEVTNEHS